MAEEYEENENGISIGDICRTIFSQKWLALIIAVAITLVGTLGLYFGYNRISADYVISFSLTLPNASTTSTYYALPGGDRFYYNDYVSEAVITEVAASDNAFSGIDVEKLIKNNDITLAETYSSVESDSEANASVMSIRRLFTITVKQKYFTDKDVAKSFLTKLANYPIEQYLAANTSVNYNIYLDDDDFENALTFSSQLNYIESQIDYIKGLYESLSNIVIDDAGTLVANARQRFNAWVTRLDLSAYSDEASTYYYLKDWETQIEKYQNALLKSGGLYDQYEDAVTNLNAFEDSLKSLLSSSATSSTDAASVLAGLQSKVTELKRQITTYENYISAYYETQVVEETGFLKVDEQTGRIWLGELDDSQVDSTAAFAARIQDIYDELTEDNGWLDQYVELNDTVYKKIATVNYQIASIVNSDGGLSIILAFVISLVVGIIVACIVAYIVAVSKRNKLNAATPAEEAAQPQDKKE